jgi:hypothetical protein
MYLLLSSLPFNADSSCLFPNSNVGCSGIQRKAALWVLVISLNRYQVDTTAAQYDRASRA